MNLYQVLVRPILTEKSGFQADNLSKYTFEVDGRATRADVERAVEKAFDVSVTKVNMMLVPGKTRRWGRRVGQCPGGLHGCGEGRGPRYAAVQAGRDLRDALPALSGPLSRPQTHVRPGHRVTP